MLVIINNCFKLKSNNKLFKQFVLSHKLSYKCKNNFSQHFNYMKQKRILENDNNKNVHNNNKKQKLRNKYINDYLYFKSIPIQYREDQLQRILSLPSLNKQYQPKFKQSSKVKQDWFETQNGIKLKTYLWQPYNQRPKAIIICYHSLNGHSLIYSQLAQKLIIKGYAIAAIDYPNFGKSQSIKRGNIQSFSSIAQPCEKYFYYLKKKYQTNVKFYMLGTSLGGVVAFCLANRLTNKQLNGLIMLSPAIKENSLHMPMKKKLGWLMYKMLPNFQLPKPKQNNGSKYILSQYLLTDPYMYQQGMWTSTLYVMLTTMLNFAKHFKYLQKPYLLIQSGNDKLCDPFLAIDLQRLSQSKDKTTVIIHDMWHNVWFDEKKQDVMKMVEEWLEERN